MVTAHANEPVEIKKYANRRLYNTESSKYVTLDDLCEMVKEGRDFVVHDAKTNEDLTRQILTQIIFEQESRGQNLLPINFLRSLIRFYDTNVHDLIPHYLEASMDSFATNQDKVRDYVGKAAGNFSPFSQLEEISKQNMALFTKAFQMFSPFEGYFNGTEKKAEPANKKKTA